MSGVDEHFRSWLRAGMTGCNFAKVLASAADRVAIAAHLELLPSAEWLNNLFDANAPAERAVVAIFPMITGPVALVDFLNSLSRDPRWNVQRRTKPSPAGDVLIGVEWSTSQGDVSHTMGFAPFGTMPVPRRAPYVAIATWPGGRLNGFRGTPPTPAGRNGEVSFLDVSHRLDEQPYQAAWAMTTAQVANLMSVPPDDASRYRRAAFALDAHSAASLAPPN